MERWHAHVHERFDVILLFGLHRVGAVRPPLWRESVGWCGFRDLIELREQFQAVPIK
jgi:hypothetical protein